MRRALITITGFLAWGFSFGLLLGGLSGTLIVPLAGTFFAGIWGMGMGAALGLLIGVMVAISDALFLQDHSDRQSYRRKLSAVMGVLTAIGAILLLISTSNGVLWYNYPGSPPRMEIFLLPSLLAATVWGGLAAAYTTGRHVDHDINAPGERSDSSQVISQFMRVAANRRTFILGGLAGIMVHFYTMSVNAPGFTTVSLFRVIVEGGAAGVVIAFWDIALLGLANGLLLSFVNRLYFKEYAPHLTLAQYKTRVSMLAFLFTLVAGLVVSGFVFVPVSAVIAAMAARSYADWLYQGDEKLKRKAKEDYSPLEENHSNDDEDEAEERADYTERPARHV